MTDITTKLRTGEFAHMAYLTAEAHAEEIDRLRAEVAGYVEANRHMKGELDDALEDARKYCEAQKEIARLTGANRKYAKALTEQQGSIDWREWMLVPATEASFVTKEKHVAEIARLREALALALDEIRECDDSGGVRAKLRAALAPAEVP